MKPQTLSGVLKAPAASVTDALRVRVSERLSFDELRRANVKRCATAFHSSLTEWTPTDYACAMAGECGEACNEVKKLRRIAESPEALAAKTNTPCKYAEADDQYESRVKKVGEEIADLVIYADLLAARLGIDLADAVADKFNAVSDRVGSPIKIFSL